MSITYIVPNNRPVLAATKLDLKNMTLNEMHVIEETQKSSSEEDKWEEYIFVVRRMHLTYFSELIHNDIRQVQNHKYYIDYVDIKSEVLQDILREGSRQYFWLGDLEKANIFLKDSTQQIKRRVSRCYENLGREKIIYLGRSYPSTEVHSSSNPP
ncbi:MAG: hypothetical protein M1839_007185 [Geoglossum umbratile]|nr:MAG: hypothetical protein M1839_007185 [Geoglossum umbratile]